MPAADDLLLAAVRAVAADVLAPAAAASEIEVPASHLDALAAAGVFGLSGAAVPPATARAVLEVLAGACGATWFVQLQHHGPAAMVRGAAAEGRARVRVGSRDWDAAELSAAMLAGDVVAGSALAHVRRADRPVRAEPDGTGWRFTGTVDWYTGWGVNDVMVLGAAAADGSVVLALVPAHAGDQVVPGEVLRPLAMGGTRTVRLSIRGLTVGADSVLAVVPGPEFATEDARRTANANPAVFGVCAASVANLRSAGGRAGELAEQLEGRRLALRAEAWHLIDEVPSHERVDDRLAIRAEAGELAVRAATAEVAAAGGRGLMPGHPAQRHAREALFLLTQAQTAALRGAQLGLLGREDVLRVRRNGAVFAEAEAIRELLVRGRSAPISGVHGMTEERARELIDDIRAGRDGR